MSYVTKNYTEQGGDVTHFGGEVVFDEGCHFTGFPSAAYQADSTASTIATLKDDFNALLAKLRTSGLMAQNQSADN